MQQKLGEGVKSQGISGSSNEGIRQEKYKKMRQKYQKQITNESGNDQVLQEKQRIQMTENYDKQASQPLVGLGNNQQLYSQNSPVTLSKKKDQFKFNQLHPQETAQNKKGATQIQQNMIIKQGLGVNLNPGTPKQSEKVFKKKDIKPSQKINSTPVQQNKKNTPNTSLTLQQQQQIQFQQQQQANQQAYSQQNNQPQKKITTAPVNSVVQTQESARNTQPTQQQQQLIIQSDIRVDTQDSMASDPGLSPRQRMINKLTKYVKLTFRQTGLPPSTTVDFYRIGKVLGKGAFGKVNLALHKLTQKFAAIKSINKQYLSEEAQTKKVMQEVVILKRTRHRNIVRLYEFFETQKHILFVIELCAGGDLLNYVRKRRRLKEDAAKYIFKQLIEGLGYCHMKGILHRDIKLDNILLDSEGEVKICDFGVSKIVKKGEKMTEQCGTPAYIAPEILRDRGYEGFAVDIWSAGVVLYAMLYGTVPFKANNMSELQKLIIKAKYTLKDDGVSEEARELITACLEKDPIKRITVNEILSHKWLVDVDESLQLFTEQEKEYIKSEFTYNDADRYNRNENVDPFTEHLLDSTQNSMLKNCTSKSVILAPFNSTKSNLDDEEEVKCLTDSVQELMQSKGCIKFAGRVRDIDKQYELNNNKDLDNGVYHKVEEDEPEAKDQKAKIEGDSDDSLQSSFNKETSMRSDDDEETIRIREQAQQKKEEKKKKKKKEKQTELEKLESLIHQEEEDQCERNEIKIEDGAESKIETYPYGQIEQIQQKQVIRDPKKSPRPELKEHNTEMNVLQSAQTLIIDEKIVSQIEMFGYPKEYIVKSLNNNELNYALTAYYLLLNEHTFSINDKFGGVDTGNNFNQMMSQSVSKTLL